ncbi:hypothetical protein VNO80_01175 [Phaseolus coccineus]|uniref:Uncharacterized protein n=1 Tax=Phaseolus coccineus TaxID=3886 RepID=A0AAN9RR18_PHACN
MWRVQSGNASWCSAGLWVCAEVQGAVQAGVVLVCLSGAYVVGLGVSKTWMGATVIAFQSINANHVFECSDIAVVPSPLRKNSPMNKQSLIAAKPLLPDNSMLALQNPFSSLVCRGLWI